MGIHKKYSLLSPLFLAINNKHYVNDYVIMLPLMCSKITYAFAFSHPPPPKKKRLLNFCQLSINF